MSTFQNVTVNNYAILKFFTTTAILDGTWGLETPYLLLQVLLLQMFSNGNWSRKSLFSGNNEQVILAQICKLKLEVIQVKGHEETYVKQSISLKVILLKSLICKGLPSKDYKDYQRKCLPCIHAYMQMRMDISLSSVRL